MATDPGQTMGSRSSAPATSTAALLLAAALLGLAAPAAAQGTRLRADPPTPRACPAGLPTDTRCLTGRDYLGAGYWMAVPARWNGQLVLHVRDHQLDGPPPPVGQPAPEAPGGDLAQWSVWLRAGYAWAGSALRPDTFAAASAAEDTERLRQTFAAEFGTPQFTWLHGHGWGAVAATRMAERFTTPDIDPRRLRGPAMVADRPAATGKRPYDGVLLTNGLLAGARNDDLVLDTRVVYQAVCNNHPRPDEPAYPLWMGLPLETRMTREELMRRIDDCTGLGRRAADRTQAQQRALATLTQVLAVPADALPPLLSRGTWQFHALVWRRLGGKNAWGNEGIRYRGNDEALQARLARYRADTAALNTLAADAAPGTRLHLPVLSLHAVRDGVAVVELQSQWRQTLEEAGTQASLLQVYTDDGDHAYGHDAQYLAAAAALRDWAERGTRPGAADVAARCLGLDARWQPASGCRMLPAYQPAPLESRVPQRRRERPADAAPDAASAPSPSAAPAVAPGPTPRLPPAEPPAEQTRTPGNGPELPPRPVLLPPFDRPGTAAPG